MIKNLVFDLGNVLVEFKPKDYLKRIGIPETDVEELNRLIFKDKRWTEFDRGTLTIDEYVNDLKNENPSYAEYLDLIFSENWNSKLLKLKENTINFLEKASKKYSIYILSNVSEYVLNYIKTFDFFKYVTSGTYSYQIKSCKPEPEIYKAFLESHKLKPEECLFMDDLPQNIEAAKKFGMNGIVFDVNDSDEQNIIKVCSFVSKHKKTLPEDPNFGTH